MNEEHIRKIKSKYETQLIKYKGVVGVGIGRKIVTGKEANQLAIIVDVIKKLPEHEKIPKSLEGVPVDVQEVGRIKAL